MPRLKAEIWVQALLRRCATEGAMGTVVRRGDATAGQTLIKVNDLGGGYAVYASIWSPEGERQWLQATGPAPVPEPEADAYIGREIRRDPDIWIIEIEDRAGRPFLTEPVVPSSTAAAGRPKPPDWPFRDA